MGAIWVKRGDLVARTGDVVGYKSGLGLTKEEFDDIIPKEYHNYWHGENNGMLRIRSEEFEEIIAHSLYEVGNIQTPSIAPSSIRLFHKYKGNEELLYIFEELFREFIELLKSSTEAPKVLKKNTIDPSPVIIKAKEKYGLSGLIVAQDIIEGHISDNHRNPWNKIRRIKWKDTKELKGLFKDESLETLYGKFLDQRYIDYLDKNFDSLGNIHWRKFEGLTCEFFERQGYKVEIGEGRNDDGGIDARVW
ncbi:restriction endonuclease, partial [Halobacillus sp. BAB-2008]|uniref:restriction endonuclease n=1 Tax=Halobacillus sp. BAB-2008 TaxID=1246484 RepID=UPI0002A4EB76